jgi:hypothetical protein
MFSDSKDHLQRDTQQNKLFTTSNQSTFTAPSHIPTTGISSTHEGYAEGLQMRCA